MFINFRFVCHIHPSIFLKVLDAGEVVEFDEPYALIQRPNSLFSTMVSQTGPDALVQLQRIARLAHEKRSCQ